MEGVSQGHGVGSPEEERETGPSPTAAGWTCLIRCPAEAQPSHVTEPGKGHFLGCSVSTMACPSFKPDIRRGTALVPAESPTSEV